MTVPPIVEPEKDLPTCDCGAPVSESAGGRIPAVVVHDTDGRHMNALLRRDLDHVRCDAGCSLPDERVLFFVFLDPTGDERILMCIGDDPSARPVASFSAAIEQAEMTSHDLMMARGRDEFFYFVKQVIRPRFEAIAAFAAAPPEEMPSMWGAFTRRNWSAYRALALGGIPGSRLLGVSDPMATASYAQTWTWQLLYLALTYSTADSGLDLEEFLTAYLDDWDILPGAVDLFAELSDQDVQTEPPENRLVPLFYRELMLAALRYRDVETPELQARNLAKKWLYLRLHIDEFAAAGRLNPERITLTPERMASVISARGLILGAQDYVHHFSRTARDDGLPGSFELTDTLAEVLAPYLTEEQLAEIWATLQLNFQTPEDAFAFLKELQWAGPHRFEHMVTAVSRKWFEKRDLIALHRLSDLVIGELPEHMAEVGAHALGYALSNSGLPSSALRIVEAITRRLPNMDIGMRLYFLMLEGQSLRRLSRHQEVLKRIEAIESWESVTEDANWEGVAVIKASVLREMNRVGESLAVFEQVAGDDAGIGTHEAFATTLMRVGHYGAALKQFRYAYDKALRVAVRYQSSRFAAQMMHCRSQMGLPADGELAEHILGFSFRFEPLSYAIGACALLVSPPYDDPRCTVLAETVSERGSDAFERAVAGGDMMEAVIWGTYLCLRAERDDPATANVTWRVVTAAMGAMANGFEERYLPFQIRRAFEETEVGTARVQHWFDLTIRAVGEVDEKFVPWVSAGSPNAVMRNAWNEAVKVATASDLGDAELQLIAEMPRSRLLWSAAGAAMEGDLVGAFAADQAWPVLRQADGSLHVIEWLGEDSGWSMLTTVLPEGTVARVRVAWPTGAGLDAVNALLRYRLATWRPARRGSPFETPGWLTWESWLRELLSTRGAPGDHVVVLRSPRHSSLPWHLAVPENLTVSYESGWPGVFLSAVDVAVRTPPEVTGVAVVPRAGEDQATIDAMWKLAEEAGRGAAVVLRGVECDSQSLSELLTGVDLAVLAVHGYVSPATGQMAYMVADSDRLPLAHSVASSSEFGRRHRFDVQQMSRLASAPATLLSGACSSALMSEAAIGYNTGVLAGMRFVGLSTLVAPQWDVIGADIFPVLSRLAHLLQTGVAPSAAVRITATYLRNNGLPDWRSQSFIVEGAW